MSQPVISVENLSKSYLIGHQGPRERYTSLRDTLSSHARNFTRRTMDTLRGKQMLQGDTVEEFFALKDVSFEVKQGDVLGIIGRNGAGKSTLLKVLSRITEPTSGKVTIRGRVASLLEVGTGFHPELSGRENIYLNGAILGMSRKEIKAKFDEIVDFAGVEKFLDTPVKRYSSGMYVRLAFAVAAHLEPEILVVDEVLAVGDAEFQKKCMGKMQDVAGEGRTVLFVSHNMTAIHALCTSGILLENGKVLRSGTIAETCEKYTDSLLIESNNLDPKKDLFVKSFNIEYLKPNSLETGWLIGFKVILSGKNRAEKIGIDFLIKTQNTYIAFGSSAYFGEIELNTGGEEVFCEVGPINFALGEYAIDVKICDPMKSWLEEHDSAARFTIERQLYANPPFALEARRMMGFFSPDQKWTAHKPTKT